MNSMEDMLRKKEAQDYAISQQLKAGATIGCDMLQPARPCLRERVRIDLQRAQREQRKAMRLAELDHLLEKHPDIASILDLMEEVR